MDKYFIEAKDSRYKIQHALRICNDILETTNFDLNHKKHNGTISEKEAKLIEAHLKAIETIKAELS